MATKAEEKKALEQIKSIIAGLGEDSYLATAFDGCIADAELNIEWDAAFSYKDRAEHYGKECGELRDELEGKEKRIEELEKELEKKEAEAEILQENLNEEQKKRWEAQMAELAQRKEVKVETDAATYFGPFKRVEFFNNEGFRFVNVVQNSGWTTSYKIDDLEKLVVE